MKNRVSTVTNGQQQSCLQNPGTFFFPFFCFQKKNTPSSPLWGKYYSEICNTGESFGVRRSEFKSTIDQYTGYFWSVGDLGMLWVAQWEAFGPIKLHQCCIHCISLTGSQAVVGRLAKGLRFQMFLTNTVSWLMWLWSEMRRVRELVTGLFLHLNPFWFLFCQQFWPLLRAGSWCVSHPLSLSLAHP